MKRGIGLTSLMLIQEVDVFPAIATCVEVNSQALDCGGVVVIPRLRVDDGASLLTGAVVAGADRPLRLPWADLCLLVILGGLVSPRR